MHYLDANTAGRREMKWWGWGDYGVSFSMADKPNLWPWIRSQLGIRQERLTLPVSWSEIAVPAPTLNEQFCADLHANFDADRYSTDSSVRLHRTFGKSYPNLLGARRGQIGRAPDMVFWPRSHDQVQALLELAHRHDVCVIPFGGGTNIVGGVDPLISERRMIVTLDLRDMNQLLHVDPYSMTAVIEAGAIGPKLEADLQAKGFSLGHFPDSFEYSTLGGWIATRSAGMQSDAYGKVEDMVVAMKVATPAGTLCTRAVPTSSAGPDLNRIMIGSEGVLGVITEATMRIHAVPELRDYRGLLFRSFEDGITATHECIRSGIAPSMIRLQDSAETQLAFNMKKPPIGVAGLLHRGVKFYLSRRGYTAPCIMVVGFEGSKSDIRRRRRAAIAIMKKHGAFVLGTSVGDSWSKDKYNVPYLRDFVMDRGIMCDVAETSMTWEKILEVYHRTIRVVRKQFDKESGGHGWIGCHISHTYKTGVCLYFTYAAAQIVGEEIQQYRRYKKLITDTFVQSGAALTHHHAVGYEHLPWMEQEISPIGMRLLSTLKLTLDPSGILNPGKLIETRNLGGS